MRGVNLYLVIYSIKFWKISQRVYSISKASIGLLSEEHATVDLSKSAKKPVLKERVHIIPNHCCVVSNLFDEVYFYSSALPSLKKIKIDARGKVW